MNNRYNSLSDLLRRRFGQRVFKVALESGFGCPNRDGTKSDCGCSFCSSDSLVPTTSLGRKGPPKAIAKQLEEGIEYIRKRHRASKVISYFQDGSNTYADAATAAAVFKEAISHPDVVGLAVSTRPDCIDEGHAGALAELAGRTMLWVELGLQSAHEATLARIGRGHSVRDFEAACTMLKSHGIDVCAHIILGLPGETHGMMMETAGFLNRVGVWGVKIHNLHILKGTRMEREYNEGRVAIPDLATYAGWACDFLEMLSPEMVVHRVSGHGPRRLTIAPAWSINKLGVMNAVHAEFAKRNSRQGAGFSGRARPENSSEPR